MNSAWSEKRIIDRAYEMADRNGFQIVEHRSYIGKVTIIAKPEDEIWAQDCAIDTFESFFECVVFFTGYEKALMYRDALAGHQPKRVKK